MFLLNREYASPVALDEALDLRDLLESLQVGLVTVDLWDTLVRHRGHPESGKRRSALLVHDGVCNSRGLGRDAYAERVRLEAFHSRNFGPDKYSQTEIARSLAGMFSSAASGSTSAAIVAHENQFQLASVSAIPSLLLDLPMIQQDLGIEIAIVSDFYASSTALRSIVSRCLAGWEEIPIFVSCDAGLSKREDGLLLRHVRSVLVGPTGKHLHIGDNAHSDGAMAVKAGSVSLLVDRPSVGAEIRYDDQQRDSGGREPRADTDREDFAMLVAFLVLRAMLAAEQLCFDRVAYLTREGVFLAEVHQALASVVPWERPPEAVVLPVSRQATFAPALSGPGRRTLLRRLWQQYPDQSPQAFLETVGLDLPLGLGAFQKRGFEPLQRIEKIAADRNAQSAIEELFRGPLGDYCASQRVLLDTWINSWLPDRAGGLVMCDVGWRGSVQENLVFSRPDLQTFGVYLGLLTDLSPRLHNAWRTGVVFDANFGDDMSFFRIPAAVEIPLSTDIPRVVRFKSPVSEARPDWFETVPGERRAEGLAAFQANIHAGVLEAAERLLDQGIASDATRQDVLSTLRRLFLSPSREHATLWFESGHDDTFGALDESQPVRRPKRTDTRFDSDLRAKAEAWPEGYSVWSGESR